MKSLCKRRVSVWNPDTSKEIVRFVHEVLPVFAETLSTLLHMLCGSNDDTMPTFNLFIVHLKCFSISGSYSWKNQLMHEKYQMKSERVENWWCGFEWCSLSTEKLWSSNKLKKCNPFLTDKFPYETLILRKRLSVLQTKCIQFLP